MTIETDLPRTPGCGARARRWLEQQLGERLDDRSLQDVKLVVTELVDNAFLHGEGAIRVQLQLRGDHLRVEVIDEGEGVALQIDERGEEVGGWGLKLVDRLAAQWGAFEGTTHVWAEIPVAPGG